MGDPRLRLAISPRCVTVPHPTDGFSSSRPVATLMSTPTVSCPDCDLQQTFEKLGDARAAIEHHRVETGHEATWDLGSLDDGVERAGDQAGVCGVPGTADPDAPNYWSGE